MKDINTFKIVKLIGKSPRELLSATETHLLNKVAFFANKHGKNARPGIQTLIRETKLSDRTVRRTLNSLVSKGILLIAFKPKSGSWRPVCYDINVRLLEEKAVSYQDDYYDYEGENELETVYTSGATVSQTPVIVPESPVIEDTNPGHSACISTNDLPISTIELPNNTVEYASDSTAVVEEPQVILEAEPTKPVPEPEPEEQPEPLAAEATSPSQPKKANVNHCGPLVTTIFAYWQAVLKHPRAKLDSNRRRYIINALKLGFSENELKKAIDGVSRSPYHMGNNDRNTVYDDIDLIFRNAKYIEKFMGYADSPPSEQNKSIFLGQKKQNFMDEHHDNMRIWKKLGDEMCPELQKYFFPTSSPSSQIVPPQPQIRQEVIINAA